MKDRRVRIDGFLILPEYLNVAERLPQFEEELDPVGGGRQMLRDGRVPRLRLPATRASPSRRSGTRRRRNRMPQRYRSDGSALCNLCGINPISERYREVTGWEELRGQGGANKIIGRK